MHCKNKKNTLAYTKHYAEVTHTFLLHIFTHKERLLSNDLPPFGLGDGSLCDIVRKGFIKLIVLGIFCGMSWLSGLVHRTQAVVLSAVECGFDTQS